MTQLTTTELEKPASEAGNATAAKIAKAIGKKRYWIAAFAFLGFLVAYMDRSNIGVLVARSWFYQRARHYQGQVGARLIDVPVPGLLWSK